MKVCKIYSFVDTFFHPSIQSLPFADYWFHARRVFQRCTALAHLDLDADWKPSKHDVRMAEYGGDEGSPVNSTSIGDVHPTDIRTVNDGNAEKPIWDNDMKADDIDPRHHP